MSRVTISGLQKSTVRAEDIVGRDKVTYATIFQHSQADQRSSAELEAALALFDTLPTKVVPPPGPLPSGSRVPMGRNALFTGRETELQALATALKGDQDIAIAVRGAAATGIGGMGKSQLANEFAHRYGRYFVGGVFWLSFAEGVNVENEIVQCGLGMPEMPSGFGTLPLEEQLRLVSARWQDGLPRLLIFDNCEGPRRLTQWQPKAGRCHLLVTSRRGRWPAHLGLHLQQLGTLPRPESIRLLRRFRPDVVGDEQALDRIAALLGDLPLALHLAGSFLARYHLTPTDYLEALTRQELLDHPSMQGRGADLSPTAHDQHVGATFAVSYEKLLEEDEVNQTARLLLSRAALFLPGEPIPRRLLLATLRDADPYDAADALDRLIRLGMVEASNEGVRLHRLVAAFARRYSDDRAAMGDVETAVNDEAFHINTSGLPAALLPWQEHLRHVTVRALPRKDGQAAALANELGYHLEAAGRYAEAEPFYVWALIITADALGARHPDTATSLNNLAGLYASQGRYDEARRLYAQSLTITEEVLGESHPYTATSLNNLAGVYASEARYGEAKPLYERALAIAEDGLGTDHPYVATSLNNLAALAFGQSRYDEAEKLFARALAIREQTLGEDHPAIAESLNNLGGLYGNRGRYPEAEPLLARAATLFERALGTDHPHTQLVRRNLLMVRHAINGTHN